MPIKRMTMDGMASFPISYDASMIKNNDFRAPLFLIDFKPPFLLISSTKMFLNAGNF